MEKVIVDALLISKLSAVADRDLARSFAALAPVRLDLPDDVHAISDRAENDVLSVQPLSLVRADEEL